MSGNREAYIAHLSASLAEARRQRDAYRATLEWVQLHDHSHDAQLARVVAEGLRGEGTAIEDESDRDRNKRAASADIPEGVAFAASSQHSGGYSPPAAGLRGEGW